MKEKHLGVFAMVIAALGLSIAVILMKVIPGYTRMPPQHVAIWRFTIAAPVFWVILKLRHHPKQFFPHPPGRFLVLGLVFSVASFSALFALQRLPSSIYVIIFYIYPSLVTLYALLTRASVPRLFWLGLPLTFAGLALISIEFGASFAIDPLGLVITLVNACAVAAYMILSEKAFKAVDDQLLGTHGVMFGAMLVGIVLIPVLGISTPGDLRGWALMISLSIFGSLVPILAMNMGLRLLTAARGSVIITVQPVLNILLGMLFLSESLNLQQWVGGGLVITAVILLARSPDRSPSAKPRQSRESHIREKESPIQ